MFQFTNTWILEGKISQSDERHEFYVPLYIYIYIYIVCVIGQKLIFNNKFGKIAVLMKFFTLTIKRWYFFLSIYVFWPVESKSDGHFRWPKPEKN